MNSSFTQSRPISGNRLLAAAIAAAILFAGRCCPAQEAAPAAVVVITDNAPLQNGRELVARVRQGERLPVVRAQGEWLLVRTSRGGRTG
jgi:hypothetical protein